MGILQQADGVFKKKKVERGKGMEEPADGQTGRES